MSRPSQGFTEVLFVRVPIDLIERLDRELECRRLEEPGRVISRADVVREILYQELDE